MLDLAGQDWPFFTLSLAKLATELDDPAHTLRLAEVYRGSATAWTHNALMKAAEQIDLQPALVQLTVPVFVIYDSGFPFGSFELAQALASLIPGARLAVVHGDREAEVEAIDAFVRGVR